MCFKKILEWFKPDPIIPVEGNRIALLYAIDNYPGDQHDLPDCIIDQKNIEKFIQDNYPEFKIAKYSDSEVMTQTFRDSIKNQIMTMETGDLLLIHYSGHGTNGINSSEPDGYSEGLYLYNGVFWDQEFQKLLQLIPAGAKVVIVLDSCFAHGSTEIRVLSYRKVRFVQTQTIPRGMRRLRPMLKTDMANYIVCAGCQEDQTSTSTGGGGAFTIHFVEAWERDFDYAQWIENTATLLRNDNYDQIPNIEGDPNLINQIIFT